MPESLLLNGKKFGYAELASYAFRNDTPLNGYEVKTLEFCAEWLNGVQEFSTQTSGSTGAPKQVVLTRKQMESSALKTLRLLQIKPEDAALVCLNTEYIGGLMMLVRGLVGNLNMTILSPASNPMVQLPASATFDLSSFVPMQLQTMLQDTPASIEWLNSMKAILVGGAPVNMGLQRDLQRITTPVYHTYGMSETVSHIALRQLNGPAAAEYYEVLRGVEIAQDKRGCLTIKADVTNNELIITNDLVEILTPTRFRWIGRIDNTLNTGGVKVQTEKLEVAIAEALMNRDPMPRFFVTSQPDELLGDKIILIVEGEPWGAEAELVLFGKLVHLLRKFEIPKEIYYSPSFSETPTGKVSRNRTLAKLGLVTS
ncbi:AMP-binding protein [Pontibacter qinzhouensis]|uniref:AMP-binding protein n=1 Tax=Pontibacter qinzhouensis TaxID=2603253 RepID=A0A5C8ILJ5_9BACT|nr:AMP-binding protein [Pontibacter qinzhouensis]TXK22021.1 AMP-binding protein [Pontibacter qinzhouensis]